MEANKIPQSSETQSHQDPEWGQGWSQPLPLTQGVNFDLVNNQEFEDCFFFLQHNLAHCDYCLRRKATNIDIAALKAEDHVGRIKWPVATRCFQSKFSNLLLGIPLRFSVNSQALLQAQESAFLTSAPQKILRC